VGVHFFSVRLAVVEGKGCLMHIAALGRASSWVAEFGRELGQLTNVSSQCLGHGWHGLWYLVACCVGVRSHGGIGRGGGASGWQVKEP
jgi:hypothetical protein